MHVYSAHVQGTNHGILVWMRSLVFFRLAYIGFLVMRIGGGLAPTLSRM